MDQTRPKLEPTVPICQNVRRFRGSSSNIRTLLTPDRDQPAILTENKSKNSQIKNVGRNSIMEVS